MLSFKVLLLVFVLVIACVHAVCPSKTGYGPGDRTITLSGGVASGRTALLHVPSAYTGTTAIPLVINFHGLGSTASSQASYTGFSKKADTKKFFVVYPQGVGNSWNAGTGCCGTAYSQKVNDVAFIKQLLDFLTQNICLNVSKIYVTGFSNGGYMTYRMGCNETGYSFAAIAPVSGLYSNYNAFPCSLSKPLPLIHFHGTADPTVPYSGVNGTIQQWATKNGCNWAQQTTTFTRNNGLCYGLACPNPATNNVTVCIVQGMGHSWAGAYGAPTDFVTTDLIWDFFSRF